jgi:hypothetical protein
LLCVLNKRQIPNTERQNSQTDLELKKIQRGESACFGRRFFSDNLAFVIQLSFAYMRAVADMCFTCGAVRG